MVFEEEAMNKEIKEIIRQVDNENKGIEEFEPKVIISKNRHKNTNKVFHQYKINLPKEFMDEVTNRGKEKPLVKGKYVEEENKIIIEIIEK